MGEQAVGRVLPTGPGPWHVEVSGVAIVVNVRARNWRGEPDGFMAWIGGEAEPYDVEHERFVWLAPVAPIGSVPPEVYARDVLGPFAHTRQDVARVLTAHGLSPDEAARVAGVAP